MKRLVTGLIITPFFLYAVLAAPDWFFLLTLAAVGCCCYFEYLGIAAAYFPASATR